MTKNELAFSSFFMGEGMIRISCDKRRSGRNKDGEYKPWYRQVVRITLRNDDSKVIDWVLKEIGGHCFDREKRTKIWNKQRGIFTWSRPVIIWQAEDIETCKRISQLLLENPIPSKKKEEAKYFLEYVKLKSSHYSRGKSYPKEVLKKFEFYHQRVKELKKYKEKQHN